MAYCNFGFLLLCLLFLFREENSVSSKRRTRSDGPSLNISLGYYENNSERLKEAVDHEEEIIQAIGPAMGEASPLKTRGFKNTYSIFLLIVFECLAKKQKVNVKFRWNNRIVLHRTELLCFYGEQSWFFVCTFTFLFCWS